MTGDNVGMYRILVWKKTRILWEFSAYVSFPFSFVLVVLILYNVFQHHMVHRYIYCQTSLPTCVVSGNVLTFRSAKPYSEICRRNVPNPFAARSDINEISLQIDTSRDDANFSDIYKVWGHENHPSPNFSPSLWLAYWTMPVERIVPVSGWALQASCHYGLITIRICRKPTSAMNRIVEKHSEVHRDYGNINASISRTNSGTVV